MYSLVTPSVLVVDAACRTRGPLLLALLEEVLLLDAAALPALGDAALRGDHDALARARAAALAAEGAAPTLQTIAAQLHALVAAGGTQGRRPPGEPLSAQLARLPMGGGLAGLRAFLAAEGAALLEGGAGRGGAGFDAQAGAGAAADALTAAWVPALAEHDRAALEQAWTSARAAAPAWQVARSQALGPRSEQVLALCADVAEAGADVLGRLAARHGVRQDWAVAMHEAAWAAHLSGRLRVVACAQVLAGRALLAAVAPSPAPAPLRAALPEVLAAATAAALQDLLGGPVAASLGSGVRTALRPV